MPPGTRTPNLRFRRPTTHSTSDAKSYAYKAPAPTPSNIPSSQPQKPAKTDPDLADLLDRWPTLAADVKAAILALPADVKAAILALARGGQKP